MARRSLRFVEEFTHLYYDSRSWILNLKNFHFIPENMLHNLSLFIFENVCL